jgi:hypothetical protein
MRLIGKQAIPTPPNITKRIEPKIVVRAIIYSGNETRMLHVVDVPDPDKYAAHNSWLVEETRTVVLRQGFARVRLLKSFVKGTVVDSSLRTEKSAYPTRAAETSKLK